MVWRSETDRAAERDLAKFSRQPTRHSATEEPRLLRDSPGMASQRRDGESLKAAFPGIGGRALVTGIRTAANSSGRNHRGRRRSAPDQTVTLFHPHIRCIVAPRDESQVLWTDETLNDAPITSVLLEPTQTD